MDENNNKFYHLKNCLAFVLTIIQIHVRQIYDLTACSTVKHP